MKIKRILAFSLVGVMMLGLVGCGKDKQDEVVIPDSTDTVINGEEWPSDETTSTEPSEEVTEPSVEETEPEPIIVEVGSLVKLENDNVALLVVGKNFNDATTNKTFDYISVIYPNGLQGKNEYVGFNHEDVTEKLDLESVILRDDIDFSATRSYRGIVVSTDLDPNVIAEMNRSSAMYTVYQKNTTESGISIGIKNISFKAGSPKDTLIFDFVIENGSQEEIIANGRFDIVLSNNGTVYECNDGLINASDIINFKIPVNGKKEGKIAYVEQDLIKAVSKLTKALVDKNTCQITLICGADVDEDTVAQATAAVEAKAGDAEVTVIDGGQPVYYFILSVE